MPDPLNISNAAHAKQRQGSAAKRAWTMQQIVPIIVITACLKEHRGAESQRAWCPGSVQAHSGINTHGQLPW